MTTRRGRRGAGATPNEEKETQDPADSLAGDAVACADAKIVEDSADNTKEPGAKKLPTTLIHPNDLASESSDGEDLDAE